MKENLSTFVAVAMAASISRVEKIKAAAKAEVRNSRPANVSNNLAIGRSLQPLQNKCVFPKDFVPTTAHLVGRHG